MVHVRLNEREANPNDAINFICPLPGQGQDDARELLRALAAQVKPVMKDHGYTVNSFEEYEHNPVFLGRNWNAGETIEIVLRRPGGGFYPTYSLLNTLCHELAHITHMNHSRAFHVLWAQLRREVEELQARGYFGDGMWSAGTRLGDGATIHQADWPEGDAPEYICGGAHKQSRQRAFRRRGNATRLKAGFTGPQTEKRGKPGRRVRGNAQFVGDGHAVNEGLDGDAKNVGIGFRKQAGSKSAREARAAAAERRLAQLEAGPSSKPDEGDDNSYDDYDDDDDAVNDEDVPKETDEDRRQMLLDSMQDDGDDGEDALEQLRIANGQRGLVTCGKRSVSPPQTTQEPPRKKAKTIQTQPASSALKAKKKKKSVLKAELEARAREELRMEQVRAVISMVQPVPTSIPPSWKCTACALDNPTSTLKCKTCAAPRTGPDQNQIETEHDMWWMREAEHWDNTRAAAAAVAAKTSTPPPAPEPLGKWVCKVCTLINPPLAPLCGACETQRR